MSDDVWSRPEIESPCQKVCLMHPQSDFCIGCLRSRHEIATWSRMSPEQRRAVMDALPARAPLVKGRRKGGRRGKGAIDG